MYFDYLVDDPSDIRVILINCKVSLRYIEVQMGYLRRMIGQKPIILKDKRGVEICKLDLPKDIRFLTQDLVIAEKEFLQIEITENYVNQHSIHES